MPTIHLRPGRERAVHNRHPWLFEGGVQRAEAQRGDMVAVHGADGALLAWGDFNPRSQIRVRVLRWGAEPPDAAWFQSQLAASIARRADLLRDGRTTAVRLVHAESDGLPGLIVDRYGDWLVLQALTLGMEGRKHELAAWLLAETGARGVWERSDESVRALEGLPEHAGLLAGEPPPGIIEIQENGLLFAVDVRAGHKTGFYLDQRDNRALLGAQAAGVRVLNCFAYTGAFSVYAAAAGAAHVTSVDTSEPALEGAVANFERNGLDPEAHDFIVADVFDLLRDLRREGRRFDRIVLDPPKFAQNQGQVQAACRGYKDINLQALHLLEPGGLLLTFSCSGAITADLFQKVVFGASTDAGVEAQILRPLWQAADHPVRLAFPEGAYLKGLFLRRM